MSECVKPVFETVASNLLRSIISVYKVKHFKGLEYLKTYPIALIL